jgi:hypothetical protein
VSATLLELAELSQASYQKIPPPPGWNVIGVSEINPDGYFGVAFQNAITGQVVIANRGTNLPDDLQNLRSDFQLTFNIPTAVQADAAAFAKQVAGVVLKQNKNATIIETGHSLGGTEAQAGTTALILSGIMTTSTVSCVTFNGPSGTDPNYVPGTNYQYLNVVDQGDVIHAAGFTLPLWQRYTSKQKRQLFASISRRATRPRAPGFFLDLA